MTCRTSRGNRSIRSRSTGVSPTDAEEALIEPIVDVQNLAIVLVELAVDVADRGDVVREHFFQKGAGLGRDRQHELRDDQFGAVALLRQAELANFLQQQLGIVRIVPLVHIKPVFIVDADLGQLDRLRFGLHELIRLHFRRRQRGEPVHESDAAVETKHQIFAVLLGLADGDVLDPEPAGEVATGDALRSQNRKYHRLEQPLAEGRERVLALLLESQEDKLRGELVDKVSDLEENPGQGAAAHDAMSAEHDLGLVGRSVTSGYFEVLLQSNEIGVGLGEQVDEAVLGQPETVDELGLAHAVANVEVPHSAQELFENAEFLAATEGLEEGGVERVGVGVVGADQDEGAESSRFGQM